MGHWTGKALLPLILLAEKCSEKTFIVVGISPSQLPPPTNAIENGDEEVNEEAEEVVDDQEDPGRKKKRSRTEKMV